MNENYELSLIVAYDLNRAIGSNGEIPWMGKVPADMRHFREKTIGKTILMGRTTFDSLPNGALPDRKNLVLTRDKKFRAFGATVINSLQEAFCQEIEGNELVVIGGAQVYEQTIDQAQKLYITEVDTASEADAFFPDVDPDKWLEVQREDFDADERNKFAYSFKEYERI